MVHWAVPILSYWYHFLTKKAFWLSAICRRLSRLFYLTVVCNALYTYLRESPTLRWRRCFKNPLPSNPKKYILLYMNRIGFKTNVRNGYASGRNLNIFHEIVNVYAPWNGISCVLGCLFLNFDWFISRILCLISSLLSVVSWLFSIWQNSNWKKILLEINFDAETYFKCDYH